MERRAVFQLRGIWSDNPKSRRLALASQRYRILCLGVSVVDSGFKGGARECRRGPALRDRPCAAKMKKAAIARGRIDLV